MHSLKALLSSRTSIKLLETTNPYEVFRAKYDDCLLIGYTTGKIVANKEKAKMLMSELLPQIRQVEKAKVIIGSDEAGKGEWLGPMVVAAIALTPTQAIELQAEGTMDSKELPVFRIREIAKFIRKKSYRYRCVLISSRKFNELFRKLKDEQRTLNDLLAWGHAKAISEMLSVLPERVEDIKIVIDEFDRFKTELRLKRMLDLDKLNIIQRPKAEENIAVAAASIVARDMREDYIDYMSRKLKVNLREKTIEDVLTDEQAGEYAKISYLKRK